MIRFSRDGTVVRATVSCPIPNYESRDFWFQWIPGDEAYAGLLSAALQTRMVDQLERIRREAYEQGWKDAKAKTVRRKHFRMGWS